MAQPATPRPAIDPNEIVVYPDGTTSGPVVVNNGDVVKIVVQQYPPGKTECIIPFGTITFNGAPARIAKAGPVVDAGGGGTIKVGS
jgi:hypothetical protein